MEGITSCAEVSTKK